MNIQRSQSTQRFGSNVTDNNCDHEGSVECPNTNPETVTDATEFFTPNETTNCIVTGTNIWGESPFANTGSFSFYLFLENKSIDSFTELSSDNWRSFSPVRTVTSTQNLEQTPSANMVNELDTNGCQNSIPKNGNFTSVDNNVDLFSSIMSITPATTAIDGAAAATGQEIDSSSQLSSLQCDQDSIPSIENKDCEYLKLVMGFKRTLVLPDVFFSYEMPVCYCPLCLSSSSSIHSCVKGWVRFKINHFVTNANQCSTSGASGIDTSSSHEWTTAFYITRVDKIRAILDHGQPLPIGKNSLNHLHYINNNNFMR